MLNTATSGRKSTFDFRHLSNNVQNLLHVLLYSLSSEGRGTKFHLEIMCSLQSLRTPMFEFKLFILRLIFGLRGKEALKVLENLEI